MRRMIAFPCAGETLVGTLDMPDRAASGMPPPHGVLLVTGGRETRFGSHRLYERLAHELAAAGHPAFRFDRRGTGDSSGDDPGYAGSAPDLDAALAAFRAACPGVRIAGFGLCDGATALALHRPAIDTLILANPWLVEPVDDLPPAAAIGRHYRAALTDRRTWQRMVTGGIDLKKALRGVARLIRRREDRTLAVTVLAALPRRSVRFVLAERDATGAAAAAAIAKSGRSASPGWRIETVASASHSFAGAADFATLLAAILASLEPIPR